MIAAETWAGYALVTAAMAVSPGPTVAYVVSRSVLDGPRAGFRAALGIELGNLAYFALTAAGLAAAIAASQIAFTALKWAGVAYLVWLGVQAIRDSFRDQDVARAPQSLPGRDLQGGLIVQLANPKTLIFFTALLPQFVDPNANVPAQLALLGATTITLEFGILGGYACAAGGVRRLIDGRAFRRWFARVSGGLLFIVAGAIARAER